MAMTMFIRFANIRNIKNLDAIGNGRNVTQCLGIVSKLYCSTSNVVDSFDPNKLSDTRINRAMRISFKQISDYKEFIRKQVAEYDIGRRHLANMMGIDPDNFTEEDVKKSIQYLFPSGLYEPQARPIMAHPDKLYNKMKETGFDETGRPHDFLFYTTKPKYYGALHDIVSFMKQLDKMEDEKHRMKTLPLPEEKFFSVDTEWLTKMDLESKLDETLSDAQYQYFIKSLERLTEHPLSNNVSSLLMEYRKKFILTDKLVLREPMQYDANNRPFICGTYKRKSAIGQVTVLGNGTGKIAINGTDISYFKEIQYREQIIFPLIFTNMSDKVDVEVTVSGGGPTGQSGLIREGIAKGLRSFVGTEMIQKMRIAGLLTHDVRVRERKKPGQEGARRKFTWKKR